MQLGYEKRSQKTEIGTKRRRIVRGFRRQLEELQPIVSFAGGENC